MPNLKSAFALLASLLLYLPTSTSAATFTHPTGIGFVYPDEWVTAEMDANALVFPKDSSKNAQGVPADFVLLGAESIGGVTDLVHPEVIDFFDNSAQALLPGASRNVEPKIINNSVLLRYSDAKGSNLKVRYRFENNLGLYAAHRYNTTSNYEEAALGIFNSYHLSLQDDESLYGAWYRSESDMTDVSYSNSGASYVATNASRTFVFEAGHRVRLSGSANVYGQSEAGGGGAYVSTGGSGDDEVGTYAVNGDQLTILWAGGDAMTYTYSVFSTNEGPALKLIFGANKPKFYRMQ